MRGEKKFSDSVTFIFWQQKEAHFNLKAFCDASKFSVNVQARTNLNAKISSKKFKD